MELATVTELLEKVKEPPGTVTELLEKVTEPPGMAMGRPGSEVWVLLAPRLGSQRI